jgi:hypothetical protein
MVRARGWGNDEVRYGKSTSLLATVIIGCVVVSGCSNERREGQDEKVAHNQKVQHSRDENVKEITARFYVWDDDHTVTLRIPAVAVKIPWRQRLQQAIRIEHNPYAVMGVLILKYDDGSEEAMTLFSPMGRVERGEECWLVDLHELKDYVSKSGKDLADLVK